MHSSAETECPATGAVCQRRYPMPRSRRPVGADARSSTEDRRARTSQFRAWYTESGRSNNPGDTPRSETPRHLHETETARLQPVGRGTAFVSILRDLALRMVPPGSPGVALRHSSE